MGKYHRCFWNSDGVSHRGHGYMRQIHYHSQPIHLFYNALQRKKNGTKNRTKTRKKWERKMETKKKQHAYQTFQRWNLLSANDKWVVKSRKKPVENRHRAVNVVVLKSESLTFPKSVKPLCLTSNFGASAKLESAQGVWHVEVNVKYRTPSI